MSQTFGPYQATVANVHDGDTIDVDVWLRGDPPRAAKALQAGGRDVDLGFDIHEIVSKHGSVVALVNRRQSVRLFGCNAPELATPAGKAALAFLQTLVSVGDQVTLVSHGWDKYGGRVDGTVTLTDGRDLTELMIAAGHAAPWDGQGAKPVPQEPAT